MKEDKLEKQEKIKFKEETRVNDACIPSRGSSPDLVIDETASKIPEPSRIQPFLLNEPKPDVKPMKLNPVPETAGKMYDIVKSSPHSEKDYIFDDYSSPPGTPLTPKTPEMLSQSPPAKAEKRKKKEKTKVKNKQPKISKTKQQPPPVTEIIDLEPERPKTPDNPVNFLKNEITKMSFLPPRFPFFPTLSAGPGLIPQMNPLTQLPTNLIKPGFGQPPHIPAMSPLNFVPTIKPPVIEEAPPLPQTPATPGESIPTADDLSYPVPVKEKHKKDKKDKIKKKNKKDKVKNKGEKRKTKEEKREKEKMKKEKKGKKKEKEVSDGERNF